MKVFDGTNWVLLREQKKALLKAMCQPSVSAKDQVQLSGLLNWIDDLMDEAEQLGYPVAWLCDE